VEKKDELTGQWEEHEKKGKGHHVILKWTGILKKETLLSKIYRINEHSKKLKKNLKRTTFFCRKYIGEIRNTIFKTKENK